MFTPVSVSLHCHIIGKDQHKAPEIRYIDGKTQKFHCLDFEGTSTLSVFLSIEQVRELAGVLRDYIAEWDAREPGYSCPNCGSTTGTPIDWDHGIDSDTGYHDAGMGCTECAK